MKLYIGNMSYDTTEDRLRQVFGEFGEVNSVNIITDRDTGRPKGFGFVEMADETAARAAIDGLVVILALCAGALTFGRPISRFIPPMLSNSARRISRVLSPCLGWLL